MNGDNFTIITQAAQVKDATEVENIIDRDPFYAAVRPTRDANAADLERRYGRECAMEPAPTPTSVLSRLTALQHQVFMLEGEMRTLRNEIAAIKQRL